MGHKLGRWSVVNPRPWGAHGPDREAVDSARAVAAPAPPADGSPRPAVARSPRRAERDSLDPAHGGAVERSPGALPLLSDVPSPVSALGGERYDATGAGSARPGPRGAWPIRPQRVLHRRHLRGGEKGGALVGKTKRGKGTKLMAIADRAGLPVAVSITSATPHEVTLVEATLDAVVTTAPPARLIGDRAYDSDPLDQRLHAERGVELIAPHRSNRRQVTQDGRPLRRSRRRWKIERLFAWLQNFRRLVTRWEYHAANFLGFVQLGCVVILLRHL